MKNPPITIAEFASSHPREQRYSTDAYYVKLANKLLKNFDDVADGYDLSAYDLHGSIFRNIALTLAYYMEDVVADCGMWRAFSTRSRELYGYDVPLFRDDDEDYLIDEPSKDAIAYLVWHAICEYGASYLWPADILIYDLVDEAYDILVNEFESAPINDDLKGDLTAMIQDCATDDSFESFTQYRYTLIWLVLHSYLLSSSRTQDKMEEIIASTQNFEHFQEDPDLGIFYASMNVIFHYKAGPFALYPTEYLADLAQALSLPQAAALFRDVEVLTPGFYHFNGINSNDTVTLEHTSGKTYSLDRDEFTLSDEQLNDEFNMMAASFIRYGQQWHLNGVMIPSRVVESKWKQMCLDDPSNPKSKIRDADGNYYLKKTGGKVIEYFANWDSFIEFATKTFGTKPDIQLPQESLYFKDKPMVMFIDRNAKKYALQLSFNSASLIADINNPYYDPEDDGTDDIDDYIFDADVAPTPMLHYLLDNNMLPTLENSQFIELAIGDKERKADVDFLARYSRRDKY